MFTDLLAEIALLVPLTKLGASVVVLYVESMGSTVNCTVLLPSRYVLSAVPTVLYASKQLSVPLAISLPSIARSNISSDRTGW